MASNHNWSIAITFLGINFWYIRARYVNGNR